MNPYYLVKITEREFADKLLDGEIFMKPLSAFGDLLRRGKESSNEFRGDVLEGVSHSFSSRDDSSFFRDTLDVEESQPVGMGQISEYFLQERIFSLYCLEYSEDVSAFIAPDRRLLDFGDTAVIIFEPLVFLRRITDFMLQKYEESFWVGAKRVRYLVDLTKFIEYDEFTKTSSYSWQNEYRIALDLSNGYLDQQAWVEDDHKTNMTDFAKIMFLNQGGKVDANLKREPTILKIGDIRDICTTVTTNELINLQLPFDKLKINPGFLAPLEPPRKPVVTAYRPIMVW
jgi:hypothetical protein